MLAASALVALSLAAPALASYTPKFSVSHARPALGANVGTTIHVTLPQADNPTAQIRFYAPAGYTATLNQAVGTTIGVATATAFSTTTGLTLPLQGNVTVDNAASHTSDPCSPGVHTAVWVVNLEVAGQKIALPVYVDATTGAEQGLGAYRILTCLPPPAAAAGGAQVLDVRFSVTGVFTTPTTPNTYRWEAIFTPYKGTTPNPVGTVEARALVPLPAAVTLKATYLAKTNTYRLRGTVSEGGTGVDGLRVKFFRGLSTKVLRQVSSTVARNGSYSTAGHLKPRRTTYFQVRVDAPERDATATGCASPLPPTVAPGGCVSATVSPFSLRSAILRIRLK